MENRYPLFAGGRILKKEALWDLRDYSYKSWQLHYADYTDGVISGCGIRAEGMDLVVGKGMIKCGDFVYLLQEEARIPYETANRLKVLKAEFEEKAGNPDYLAYSVKFFLDDNEERKKDQIELCRFHLRTGSVLRDTYKDFHDMRTEYDTINLLYATMAGQGQERLHPGIVDRFWKELQKREEKETADYVFGYQIANAAGAVTRELIAAYLSDRKGGYTIGEICNWDNGKLFDSLGSILGYQSGTEASDTGRKVIYIE